VSNWGAFVLLVVLAFCVSSGSGLLNDTWLWDVNTSTWTEVTRNAHKIRRLLHAKTGRSMLLQQASNQHICFRLACRRPCLGFLCPGPATPVLPPKLPQQCALTEAMIGVVPLCRRPSVVALCPAPAAPVLLNLGNVNNAHSTCVFQ
jgi:hypothetical protein